MSTMGYTYHQCPKCNEILVFFSEISSFEAAGTPKFSDGVDEYFSFWSSGYLKECPECKHLDLPSNFSPPDKANFDFATADPSQYRGLRSTDSSEKIENWLSQNKVPPKIEFEVRFPIYNRERVKDIEVRRGMQVRQNNSRKLFEIAMYSDNPELIFRTAEICRGSNLISESMRLISVLEQAFPDWNQRLVQEAKLLISMSSSSPKMIVSSQNGTELRDIQ
jgi:phage FluMu protein Com